MSRCQYVGNMAPERHIQAAESTVWAANDAWRKHPMLTGNYRRCMPGFGIAAAAFGVYMLASGAAGVFTKKEKEHH